MSEKRIATFRSFEESTKTDWADLTEQYKLVQDRLADRVIEHLLILGGDRLGYPIDRLEHSLQTATRAEVDGRDDEYVVCALVHDVGDSLAPDNHEAIAAAILKPFVSPANHWMVAHHGIFQGYYFWHHIGLNRHARDEYLDHEHYEQTVEFCAKYDQVSFDADYPTRSLEHFEPLLRSFFRHK